MDQAPIRDIVNSFNTKITREFVSSRYPVLEWLSTLDPHERHWAISINRVAGVGDWLLSANQFTQWRSRDLEGTSMPVLFCYGDPGAGKTFLRYE